MRYQDYFVEGLVLASYALWPLVLARRAADRVRRFRRYVFGRRPSW
jgi:hypothetical protein